MRNAREIFESVSGVDVFRRVSRDHVLDLYCGIDDMSRYTLLLISDTEPENVKSSKVINIGLWKRNYDRWTLSFSLVDNIFKDIFVQFCDDMIESSATLGNAANGPKFICARYNGWQQMLSAARGDLLSKSEIKGIIGEMFFILEYLFPKYGMESVLHAWMGPKMADQDFVFEDTWYEIKATTSDAEHIRISSVEQLDSLTEGTLAVLALDQTSELDELSVTANSLYRKILSIIGDDSLKMTFSSLLLRAGFYPRPEYDEYIYRPNGMRLYRVDETFPCLRRSNVPNSVADAVYTLTLAVVRSHLKEGVSLHGCK